MLKVNTEKPTQSLECDSVKVKYEREVVKMKNKSLNSEVLGEGTTHFVCACAYSRRFSF